MRQVARTYLQGKACLVFFAACLLAVSSFAAPQDRLAEPRRVLTLAPNRATNCRNSEGDFIRFKDGRIAFIYSHYRNGGGADNAPADLRMRTSHDGGLTWTAESELFVDGEGRNVMSVSCLRERGGDVLVFYLDRPAKTKMRDGIKVIRTSDEGRTWSMPVSVVAGDCAHGYSVLNNSRVIQLKSGRIVVPLCLHCDADGKEDWSGKLYCCLSDDGGRTWRSNRQPPFAAFDAKGRRVKTQEPGVVELKDGKVLMWTRTDAGTQWVSLSADGGETWTKAEPWTLASPLSPATVKRLANGDLLAVWNDHEASPEFRTHSRPGLYGSRTPLMLAVSKDEGRTWIHRRALEGDPKGCFCYTAAYEVGDVVLLGYCAVSLDLSHVTAVPRAWIYSGPAAKRDFPFEKNAFTEIPEGPVRELKLPSGVWTAEAGHFEVKRTPRGRMLHLLGGTDREAVFTLPKPGCSSTALWIMAERASAAGAFEFDVQARTTDGDWKSVCSKANKTMAGRLIQLQLEWLKERVTAFRFRCTSPDGVYLAHPDSFVVRDAFFRERQ